MGAMSGVSDIIVILDGGKTVFIELKLKTMTLCKRGPLRGKMVPKFTEQGGDQIAFMCRAAVLGFPYHVVHATDISDGLNQIVSIIQKEGEFSW